jgi:uncharacterized membrane protein YeaQ/YmgE (transglycosylase-associated protein family)
MFFLVILSWIAAGLVIGYIASRVVNLRGDDPRFGIGAAALGAVVAGVIYSVVTGTSIATWTLWGFVTAAVVALLTVVAWHLIRSRTISHERYVPRSSY